MTTLEKFQAACLVESSTDVIKKMPREDLEELRDLTKKNIQILDAKENRAIANENYRKADRLSECSHKDRDLLKEIEQIIG